MGVDAKLAVVCKKEEKMTVVGQILHTLNKLALDKLRTKYESCTLTMVEKALDELLADKPKEKK